MSVPPPPHVGLTQVDQLIMHVLDLGGTFPQGLKRWQLLAWAAEQIEARRLTPSQWERGGWREIHLRHFPNAPGMTATP